MKTPLHCDECRALILREDDQEPDLRGHYFFQQPDGTWRAVLYVGYICPRGIAADNHYWGIIRTVEIHTNAPTPAQLVDVWP